MSKFNNLLLFLLIISLNNIFAQEVETDSSIEEIVVTGSYLKTSPTDGASPIDVIDRDAIENFGVNTVADLVRNLASNSGSENVPDSFTSGSTQGTSNINLRGLGLSSTLVLIDGRRQTVAGATANDGSVFVNTSIIPLIAIERVEVLKEGAASVYGSDAVAGVVNYIFRRDFTGLEVSYNHQFTDIGSQEDDRVSLIFGEKFGNTNVVIAADFLERSPMSSALRPESTQLGISGLGNSFLLFGPSTVESGPYAGSYTPFTNVPDANCVENNGFIIPQASGSRCGFLYGPRFNIVNDEEHQNVYGSIKSDLANGMEFNADVLFSSIKVNDNPQSPSYPALSYLSPSNAILPGQGGNPFGVPVLWLGRPLGSAFPSPNAPRDIDNLRFSLGLTGNLGGFDWDLRYTHSETDHYFYQPDTSTTRFSAAIAGHAQISDEVIIGGNCGIQQFTRIGRMAMIGGMSGVSRDVIPYGLSFGNRNYLEGINLVGLRRKKVSNKEILALSDAYKEIFKTNSLHENLAKLSKTLKNNSYVREVVDFINHDKKRPICTPLSK